MDRGLQLTQRRWSYQPKAPGVHCIRHGLALKGRFIECVLVPHIVLIHADAPAHALTYHASRFTPPLAPGAWILELSIAYLTRQVRTAPTSPNRSFGDHAASQAGNAPLLPRATATLEETKKAKQMTRLLATPT